MNLEERVVIVTGGSGLLGKAMIRDFKGRGATAINFDLCQGQESDGDFIYCDITDIQCVDQALGRVLQKHGRIDGLVNNAYPRTKDWATPFESIPFASWQKNIDTQLNSYFYVSQQVLKQMRIQRSGSMVNIASIYGVVGNDFAIYQGTNIVPPAAYSAIKGGLINLTRYLASLYGEFGVRVNCLSPGGIFDHQEEAFVKAYEQKVPMKRMGTPDDIASPIAFLLSEDARYITGQNLIVDGGGQRFEPLPFNF